MPLEATGGPEEVQFGPNKKALRDYELGHIVVWLCNKLSGCFSVCYSRQYFGEYCIKNLDSEFHSKWPLVDSSALS